MSLSLAAWRSKLLLWEEMSRQRSDHQNNQIRRDQDNSFQSINVDPSMRRFQADNQIFRGMFYHLLDSEDQETTIGSGRSTFRLPFLLRFWKLEHLSRLLLPDRRSLWTLIKRIVDLDKSSRDLEVQSQPGCNQPSDIFGLLLSDDSEISIDVDQVGSSSPNSGLKVYLSGRRGWHGKLYRIRARREYCERSIYQSSFSFRWRKPGNNPATWNHYPGTNDNDFLRGSRS